MPGAPNKPDTFHIKRNDLLPPISIEVFELDGTPIDLSSASAVAFTMRGRDGTLKVSSAVAAKAVGANGTIENRLLYQWAGTDTDTPGAYLSEFQVTLAGGQRTFPAHPDQLMEVRVGDDLDDA